MPDRSIRTRVFAALAAALLVGLTACSDAPTPEGVDRDTTGDPMASRSPAPSRSAGEAPMMPAAARGTSRKAAIAFVEHYVKVLNHAMVSGQTDALNALSSPNCGVCGVMRSSIAGVERRGGSLRGHGWSLSSAQYLQMQPRNAPVIRTVMDVAPQVAVESRGAKPTRFDGGQVLYTFRLSLSNGTWTVDRLQREM